MRARIFFTFSSRIFFAATLSLLYECYYIKAGVISKSRKIVIANKFISGKWQNKMVAKNSWFTVYHWTVHLNECRSLSSLVLFFGMTLEHDTPSSIVEGQGQDCRCGMHAHFHSEPELHWPPCKHLQWFPLCRRRTFQYGHRTDCNTNTSVPIRANLAPEKTPTIPRVYFWCLLGVYYGFVFFKTFASTQDLLLIHSRFTLGLLGVCCWGPLNALN